MKEEKILSELRRKIYLFYRTFIPLLFVSSLIGVIYIIFKKTYSLSINLHTLGCSITMVAAFISYFDYKKRKSFLDYIISIINKKEDDIEGNEILWIYKEKTEMNYFLKLKRQRLVIYINESDFGSIALETEKSNEVYNTIISKYPGVSFGWDEEAFSKLKKEKDYLRDNKVKTIEIRRRKI